MLPSSFGRPDIGTAAGKRAGCEVRKWLTRLRIFVVGIPRNSFINFNYTTNRCVFSRSNTETYRLTKHFTTKNFSFSFIY